MTGASAARTARVVGEGGVLSRPCAAGRPCWLTTRARIASIPFIHASAAGARVPPTLTSTYGRSTGWVSVVPCAGRGRSGPHLVGSKPTPRVYVILDTAGNRSLSHLRRALTLRGTLAIVGGEEGDRWIGGTDRQLRAMLLSPFVRHHVRTFVARVRQEDLRFLGELIDPGKVTPVINRTYPLAEAPAAIRRLAEGRVRGKVVITM
ncbi:MAG: zinc-binding dehydrogenase [Gemmatimonadota bacterium]|nr:zinc-binding dehydrogenase [Gemmatimonadota bacterium]